MSSMEFKFRYYWDGAYAKDYMGSDFSEHGALPGEEGYPSDGYF
jgi:hypothetical protein